MYFLRKISSDAALRFVLLTSVFCFAIFATFPGYALSAQTPPQILTYQGRLTDNGGNLLGGAGTTYYFKFSIWTSPTVGAGTRVWPATSPTSVSTSVKQGVFTVHIGDTANGYPTALTLDFSANPTLYLQVEASADNATFETLSPRQQITSAAFAQLAGAVVGATTPSSFGTTTPTAHAFVTIAATSTDSIALSIEGFLNQAANLFQVRNNSGSNLFSIGATGGVTMANATATSLFATTASSTNLFTSNLSIGSLSGILKATAGVIGTALVNLASDVTGVLPASNGGTGWASIASGSILYGNGTGALSTTTVALGGQILGYLSGVPTWVSTTTLNIGGTAANVSGIVGQANGGTGLSSYAAGDILYADNGGNLARLPKGTNGLVLKLASGLPSWAPETGGGGGGLSGAWATTSASNLAIYPTTPSWVVVVGNNATTTLGNILEVTGQSYFSDKIGIGTTSPSALLSVAGNGLLSGSLTATNLTATGSAVVNGSLTAGSASFTSALPVTSGGTGWGSIASGALVYGNGSSAVATTSQGNGGELLAWMNGVPSWISTTTLNVGGNAGTATKLLNARMINGTSFDGSGNITVTAASSSLLSDSNTFSGNNTFSNPITGSISGNAGTVTNGVYTTTFNGLFDNRLSATTSLPNITTLGGLSLPATQLTNFGTPF
ncbi:MAG TPA: hypothetical protein VFP46_01985, partial [Candidatus Paceibacterota bacterium]|nr:hypothetical protein [Candidatus Paceibacterota bacterium]